jgi:hypothetical protein
MWRDATTITAVIGGLTAMFSALAALVRAVRAPAATLDGD